MLIPNGSPLWILNLNSLLVYLKRDDTKLFYSKIGCKFIINCEFFQTGNTTQELIANVRFIQQYIPLQRMVSLL